MDPKHWFNCYLKVKFDADPDPGSALKKMDSDPDPGHFFQIY